MWIGDSGRILSLQNRPENDAVGFLRNILKNKIKTSGVSNGLLPDFKKGFKIQYGKQVKNKFIKKAIQALASTDEYTFYSS